MIQPSVAVAYLAREADGPQAFERFVRSYLRFDAGVAHDLVVLYKGFTSQTSLGRARDLFSPLKHTGIELQDIGFDVGSYLECAKRIQHPFACFLNTHTEIAAGGWLRLLLEHIKRPCVGLAGSTGSYESLSQSWELIQKFFWIYYFWQVERSPAVNSYYAKFREYIDVNPAVTWRNYTGRSGPVARLLTPLAPRLRLIAAHASFGKFWRAATGRGSTFEEIVKIPRFPNPHIRSNGFIVKRERLLDFLDIRIETKDDACFFESGPDSLTARIRRSGFEAVVVGRNGDGYGVGEWPRSRTFRLEDQSNLLLRDNHCRAFDEMSPQNRFTHAYLSWGPYIGDPPDDFPFLGMRFKRGTLQPNSPRGVT